MKVDLRSETGRFGLIVRVGGSQETMRREGRASYGRARGFEVIRGL